MMGATPLDLPGTLETCRVSMPKLGEIPDGVFAEHVVADLGHHQNVGAELGGGHGLVRALAAAPHLEASAPRSFRRFAGMRVT